MDDHAAVAQLLGREPLAEFDVVVRSPDGAPLVILNRPLTREGVPMPTRWWLVGKDESYQVSRLEAEGGVRAAETAVDPVDLARAHEVYAAERDADLPPGWAGPAPHGGVGGTKAGVKCLHAHYAWYLAGGPDPVGAWVQEALDRTMHG